MLTYIVVGTKPWNRKIFDDVLSLYPGRWLYTDQTLNIDELHFYDPRYIFFLHWSERVPADIFENYECVVFHPTALPHGRGGTPLQNMIVRGYTDTQLTAFRMIDKLDAGPVYYRRHLSLKGNAQQIFEREMKLAAKIIYQIITKNPVPHPQRGKATYFKRRKPWESEISPEFTMYGLYDFIRMLDAETYPKAFITLGSWRLEFSDAQLDEYTITAKVSIKVNDE